MAIQTHTLIASYTATSAITSLTFSNIPQNYTDLYIEMFAKDSGGYLRLRPNNDPGATNYQRTNLYGMARNNADTASNIIESGRGANESGMYLSAGDSTGFSPSFMYVLGYSSPFVTKVFIEENQFVKSLGGVIGTWNFLWKSAAPIVSLVFDASGSATTAAGTTINIYGINAVSTNTFAPTKAVGGNYAYSDGTYAYHVFNTTGSFTPTTSITAQILAIGGGGAGGGFDIGGGGGAGGVVLTSSQALASGTNYTCTVGAGGYGSRANGTNGSSSNVTGGAISLTAALGGGYGAGFTGNVNGGSGASGGGGGETNYVDGTGGSATQGYAGAAANGGSASGGGGGGAAGAASGSTGGAAITTYSAWADATRTGVSGSYAGGGGGGRYGGAAGFGGGGGAGNGGSNLYGYIGGFGSPNTGSGGGGAGGGQGATDIGGNGGSGIIIVRYTL